MVLSLSLLSLVVCILVRFVSPAIGVSFSLTVGTPVGVTLTLTIDGSIGVSLGFPGGGVSFGLTADGSVSLTITPDGEVPFEETLSSEWKPV